MEVRYIGQTMHPSSRKSAHCNKSKISKENNHRSSWVLKILENGSKPIFEILEECAIECMDDRGIYWIAKLRNEGARLTNTSEGGKTARGWKLTQDQISKFSTSQKGKRLSETHKAIISENRKGVKATEETRRKMSVSRIGLQRSKESIRKTSEFHMGRKRSLDTRLKQKAKWEQRRLGGNPKGVVMDGNRWRATVCWESKRMHIGMFDSKEEAALAVIEKEKSLIAEFARIKRL